MEPGLRPHLNRLADNWSATDGPTIRMFLRDDDIDEDEETLRNLLDISLACQVPLNVEVIPKSLIVAGIRQLGFKVFSKERNPEKRDEQLLTGYGFRESSASLDIFRWKGQATLKPPADIIAELIPHLESPLQNNDIQNNQPIGIMLHHKVMDADAFAFLYALLRELGRYPFIEFHTFEA